MSTAALVHGLRTIAKMAAGDSDDKSETLHHVSELGGLGVLAAPSAIEAYHEHYKTHPRAGSAAHWLTHGGKPWSEIAGLGILGIPTVHSMLKKRQRAQAAQQQDAPAPQAPQLQGEAAPVQPAG